MRDMDVLKNPNIPLRMGLQGLHMSPSVLFYLELLQQIYGQGFPTFLALILHYTMKAQAYLGHPLTLDADRIAVYWCTMNAASDFILLARFSLFHHPKNPFL